MSEEFQASSEEEAALLSEVNAAQQAYQTALRSDISTENLAEYLSYLWALYANCHIMIISPYISQKSPPEFIKPAPQENVYTIIDDGYSFSTSKIEDMHVGTMTMSKLYNTINKMMQLVLKRLKEVTGTGTGKLDPNGVYKIGLFGHELARRKSFALAMDVSEITLDVENYDPVDWGHRFIETLKYMVTSGHGTPSDLKNVANRIMPSAQ